MRINDNHLGYDGQTSGRRLPGFLSRALAFVATVVVIGVAFMFSVLVFAVAVTVGLVAWGYLWWKMRGLRKQMNARRNGGDVLEGEVIRVVRETESHRDFHR